MGESSLARENRLARIKAWKKRNPDKVKASYLRHREYWLEYGKKYHEKHRERDNAKCREYAALHHGEKIAMGRAYYWANREGLLKKSKEYRISHAKEISAYMKKARILHRYGITYDEFMLMIERQDGACAICGGNPWDGKSPCLDHDHATGKVRGVLCRQCNLALGGIKDSVESARSMVRYLEFHSGGSK